MGETTEIEWSDATWNPWRGCDKVSPGCAHCYMFTAQRRYGRDPSVVVRAAPGTFNAPLRSKKWLAERDQALADRGRHLVFTCSWSDWFHEDADGWRDEAWDVIRSSPLSTWQILTKRPERILEHLPADWGEGWPNVWLGTSIENRRFVSRAAVLGEIPAVVRFVSAEPLLGPVIPEYVRVYDPHPYEEQTGDPADMVEEAVWADGYEGPYLRFYNSDGDLAFHWLIAGGESGPGRRRMDKAWVRDLRDVCVHEGVAFFYKQGNGPHPGMDRDLDGRTWDEMPKHLGAAGGTRRAA